MSPSRTNLRIIRIAGAVLVAAFALGAAGCMKQPVAPVAPVPSTGVEMPAPEGLR